MAYAPRLVGPRGLPPRPASTVSPLEAFCASNVVAFTMGLIQAEATTTSGLAQSALHRFPPPGSDASITALSSS